MDDWTKFEDDEPIFAPETALMLVLLALLALGLSQ
jgi:hypothetical protein